MRRIMWMGLVLWIFASGCGKPMGNVTGLIEWHDQPVVSGEIQFEPLQDKTVPIVSGLIRDGKYRVSLPTGEKRVRIFVYEKTGIDRSNPAMPIDIITNIMPKKYNTESEMTYTVKKGLQEYHFPAETQ